VSSRRPTSSPKGWTTVAERNQALRIPRDLELPGRAATLRKEGSRLIDRIEEVGEENVFTSVIVACELRYAAANRGSRRLTTQVEAVLSALSVRPLESDVERIYAAIRVGMEKKGTPIGAHDMLIAAHARALNAVCVTDTIAEVRRVPALVENWLRPDRGP
jgi:tRNA(fMet)-specific endonuclease VapC